MIPIRDMLLLLTTLLLWGAFYVAGKWALEGFPPLFLTALRFVIVAAVLLPWAGVPNISFKRVFIFSILLGVFNFGFGLAAMDWGLDVATAIIVGQMGVPFSCMFGAIILKDSLGPWRSFGLVIAMMGAVVIAGTPNASSNFIGFIAMISACVGWGLSNILMKSYGEVKIMPLLAWMSLFSCAELLALSAILETGQIEALSSAGAREWGSVVFLALGTTVIAYAIWYYLLSKYLASQITPYTMLCPFIAIGLDRLIFSSPISPQVMTAGLITIIGVSIIVLRRPRLAMLGKVVTPQVVEEMLPEPPILEEEGEA